MLDIVALVITLTALFSYLNYRYVGLPTTIGVMVIALALSLAMLGAHHLGWVYPERLAREVLGRIDFEEVLLQGMLSFLLFAGALHVNLDDLARQKWVIIVLATAGVVTSTFLVGGLAWWLFGALGLDLPLIWCLLFGALISPTDPIAVLGLLKTAGVPRTLETKITGESLFNDGIAVVVFLVLLGIAAGGHEVSAGGVALLLAEEALGGILFGLAIGYAAYSLLRRVDDYRVEVLITLALVMGGYALASEIHVSGPLAMVVAGLLIGNHGRLFGMSDHTRAHLDTFWELIDEVLNATLFVLIGLELIVLNLRGEYLVAGLAAIPAVLLARLVSVGLPIGLMRVMRTFSPNVVRVMTWGGLRGGISVAMALALPPGAVRDALLTITYVVVVFSIVVQGLTIEWVAKTGTGAGAPGS